MQSKPFVVSLAASCFGIGYVAGNLYPALPSPVYRQLNSIESKVSACSRKDVEPIEMRLAPGTVHIDWSSIRDQLLPAIRDELRKNQVASVQEKVADADVPEQSRESLIAYDEGQRIVDAAIRARKWRDVDLAAFRSVMARLSAEQQQELLKSLVPKLNNGEVLSETSGPPI
jgi:hypothetical protein